jgi:hypothetical protein
VSSHEVWDIFSDVFDACFPDLYCFGIDLSREGVVIFQYNHTQLAIPTKKWNAMTHKERVLMKLGLIHKILDELEA